MVRPDFGPGVPSDPFPQYDEANEIEIELLGQFGPSDYVVRFTGSTYLLAAREDSGLPDYSDADLATAFNAASLALGNASTFTNGGHIAFSRPAGGVMEVTAPLKLYTNMKLTGPGRSMTLKATGSAWASGYVDAPTSRQAPKAVIDAYGASRVWIEGLEIDCDFIDGTTGILYKKGAGETGGDQAGARIFGNGVQNFDVSGIQVGKSTDSGFTGNYYIQNNFVNNSVGSNPDSMALALYIGDGFIGPGNNFKTVGKWCVFIAAGTIQFMGPGHVVNNAATGANGHIFISAASNVRIQGLYIDNVKTAPAVMVSSYDEFGSASGGCGHVKVIDNWINGDPQTNGAFDVVYFDASGVPDGDSNASFGNAVVAGNWGKGNNGTHRIRAVVGTNSIAAGSTRTFIDPMADLSVTDNTFNYTQKVFVNDGTVGTEVVAPPVCDSNYINQTGGTVHGQETADVVKAGAVADSDFLHPRDGLTGVDITNDRFYFRSGGGWFYVQGL